MTTGHMVTQDIEFNDGGGDEVQTRVLNNLRRESTAVRNGVPTVDASHNSWNAYRILEAPGISDDFYLNVLDWSTENIVAVGLGSGVHLWSTELETAEWLFQQAVTPFFSRPASRGLATSGRDHDADGVSNNPSRIAQYSVRMSDQRNPHVTNRQERTSEVVPMRTHDPESTSTPPTLCIPAEKDQVCAVKWSEGGRFLAVGFGTGEVQIWDPNARRKLRSYPAVDRGGEGHSGRCCSATWCDSMLITGSRDHSAICRDVRTREPVTHRFLGHRGDVCAVRYSPSERYLATGGNDNAVCIWDARVDPGAVSTKLQPKVRFATSRGLPWIVRKL
eukprot:GHVT01064767.1.p1 GENE.GHVT01064767.1~~GHVT01064767.1.p1  ORF type:complete len:333 (+),score=-7.06 GHVT01064767.1:767-1765(+)